jgi:hypothetical protein
MQMDWGADVLVRRLRQHRERLATFYVVNRSRLF